MIHRWHLSVATVALCVASTATSQNADQRKEIGKTNQAAELERLGAEHQAKFEREEARVLVYLSKHPDQSRLFERNGSTYYLARLDADGNPVYINTKGGGDRKHRAAASPGKPEWSHGGGAR